MYTEDELEEKHGERLEASNELDDLFEDADIKKEWYDLEVNTLIYRKKIYKTKAEAQIQTEQKEAYTQMRKALRDYKLKSMKANRLKLTYYHIRRSLDAWRELDWEANRMWALPRNNWRDAHED